MLIGLALAGLVVFGGALSAYAACSNPSPLPSRYAAPCPVWSISSASISQSGTLTLSATPQPGTDYIYTTAYYAKGSTWLPVTLTGNNAAPSYSSGLATGSLPASILSSLPLGTNYIVLWDWLWDAAAQCYKGPGLNQCNTGTWRLQTFSLTSAATPTPAPYGTCSPAFGSFGPNNWPNSCWTPYSKTTSVFNARIPANPRLMSNSAGIVTRLLGDWSAASVFELNYPVAPGGRACAHPYFFSSASDPIVTVQSCSTYGSDGLAVPKQIHVPAVARPNLGCSDHHISIVDQSTSTEYDFYQGFSTSGYPNGGTITTGACGQINIQTGSGIGPISTTTRMANMAGMIRGQELQQGVINHALFVVTSCDNGHAVYPAAPGTGFDICTNTTNAPPMGALYWVDYTDAQIAALSIPTYEKTILTALAHYGAYVGDQGGPVTSMEMIGIPEGPETYYEYGATQPYVTVAKAAGIPLNTTLNSYIFTMGGIDWANHLHVLDPCVPLGLTGQPGGCASPL